ncbi:MAG: hypothetical protein ACOC33_00450 [bacterium]
MKSKKEVKTIIAQSLFRKLPKFEIIKVYKKHGIIREKLELYKDFVTNLSQTILDSYFGKEYIKTEEDVIGHYNWSYNKVINQFKEEDIYFDENDNELYSYFFNYYLDTIYLSDKIISDDIFLIYWTKFFKDSIKTNSELNALIEIYEIFENSLIID